MLRPPSTRVAVGAAALLILGMTWSLASPLASSPGDDFHLASIWCAPTAPSDTCADSDDDEFPGHRTVLVPEQIGQDAVCFRFSGETSAACQPGGTDPPRLRASRANISAYPGGYYDLMGLFVGDGVVRSALFMRGVAWMVAIGLLAAAAATAPPDLRRAFTAAVLGTCVPLGVFLFASNNPSGFTVAVASAAALVAAGGHQPALRRRSALPVADAVVGAATFVRGGKIDNAVSGIGPRHDRELIPLLFENLLELPQMVTGSLGTWSLGWLDTPMPAIVTATMIGIVAALAFAGVARMSLDKWLALGVVGSALAALPMYVLANGRNEVGEVFQPRSVLPLLPVAIAGLLLGPRGARHVELRGGQRWALAVGVVVAHAAALHANIRRYVTGIDVDGLDLGAATEWWWAGGPSPLVTWLLGSVAFAVVVALLTAAWPSETETSPRLQPSAGLRQGGEHL